MEYFNAPDTYASEGSDVSPEESVCNQEMLMPQLKARKNRLKNRAYQKVKSSFNCNSPKQLEVQERSINFGVRQTNLSNHPTIVEHKIKLVKDHRLRMSLPSVESCTKNVETIYYGNNKEGGDTIKGELADFLTYPVNLENIRIPRKRELHALMHHRICNNVNPDIVLIVENYEFFCHRMVLQCYSKYFDDINNLGDENVITIEEKGVTKQAFTAVYAWMISLNESGLKYITRENFVEVLMASQILQIRDLEEQCLALMDSTEVFSEGHAYQLFKQASRHNQKGIKELMIPRIQHFFLPFVSTQDYLDLSLEDLCTFLTSNYIVVHSEMEVFMSAARWLLENWNDRKQYLSKVMNCVRFGLMNPLELVDIRKNPESPEFLKITENSTIQKYIDDGLAYSTYCTMKGSTEDLKYRCQLFGLEIPQPRNWTETPKHYKSYNEFLNYLKQIRANPLKIIADPSSNTTPSSSHNYPVNQEGRPLELDFNSPMHAFSDGIPSMSNLLSLGLKNREKKNKQKTILTNNTKLKAEEPLNKTLMIEERKRISNLPLHARKSRESLKSKAATIIQAAYRGYRVRKKINFCENIKINRQTYDDHSLEKADLLGPNIQDINHYKPFKKSSSDVNLPTTEKATKLTGMGRPNNSPAILILGGLNPQKELTQSNDGRSIFRYSSENKKWERIGYLPKGRYYLSSAYLKGKVYVLGGVDPKREEQRLSCICSDVWSFNPTNLEWNKETNLRTPRKNFGVVAFQGHIYAIGGQGPNDAILSSVEKYDPIKKIWEEICPLPEPRLSPAVTVFGGSIWVAGGMGVSVKNAMAVQVYAFDIRQNRWINKPSLRSGKGFSVLVSHEDKLYLVGGAEKDKERCCSVSSNTIDVYDPKLNKWEVYSQMRIPRHSHTSAILGDCLYVIGGTTTQQMKSLNDVEICCLETRSWKHNSPPLPMVLTGHSSVLLPCGSNIMR